MPKYISQEEFIQRCKAKHGDKYDYSKVIYTGMKNDVIVICTEHGEWTTKAQTLLISGCRICGIKTQTKKKIKRQENPYSRIKKSLW